MWSNKSARGTKEWAQMGPAITNMSTKAALLLLNACDCTETLNATVKRYSRVHQIAGI